MVKPEGIRIFLRIRPPATSQQSYLMSSEGAMGGTTKVTDNNSGKLQQQQHANGDFSYDVDHTFEGSTIHFHLGRRDREEVVNNTTDDYVFNFRRVFEPRSTQADVFNTVAKDCVLSVIEGYNSTVFAYGQTGSGKTYSITGGTESYEDRGIIPRALALIYEEIGKRNHEFNWTVSIAYLQIYNDKGQDLLNHGKDAKTLDDLPPVTVHEGDDEIVLRGLEQHYAPTLTDALNLLFLGDTNRLYCETPMNKTSSRSHCVFTVSLEARSIGSSVVRRSKLNLVDLAGSERVSRTGVNGTVLKEAKYINLSLHYLAHVIVALGEQAKGRRDHVPYRNSFMTMVLRDSLGGNCRTSMLATVHAAASVAQETLSTCQFARSVALIKQHAQVNEETDPLMLVKKLRAEVAQLRDRLAFYEKSGEGGGADRTLSEDEMALCRGLVDKFMHNSDPGAQLEGFEGDLARIHYCFSVLKGMATTGSSALAVRAGVGGSSGGGGTSADEHTALRRSPAELEAAESQLRDYREQVDALQISLQQKENEMNTLFGMLNKVQGPRFNAETQVDAAEGTAMDASGGWGSAEDLIRRLRQRAGGSTAYPAPSAAPVVLRSDSHAEDAAAAAAQLQQHVQKLAQAGALTEAQTTAAQEFIDAKKEAARLLESYDLSALTDANLLQDRTAAFESFKRSYRHYAKVEAMKGTLKARYETCKETAKTLNGSVDAMKAIKARIQRLRAERAVEGREQADPVEEGLLAQLSQEKEMYNSLATTLRAQKEEIDAMHAFMKRSQEQLSRDFDDWFRIRQDQLVQATAQQEHAAQETPHTEVQTSRDVMASFRAGSASSAPLLPTPPSLLPPGGKMTTAIATSGLGKDGVGQTAVGSVEGSAGAAFEGVAMRGDTLYTAAPSLVRHPSSAPSAAVAMSGLAAGTGGGMASRLDAGASVMGAAPRALPSVNTFVAPAPPRAAAAAALGGGGGGVTLSSGWSTSPRPANTHHLQPLNASVSPSSSSPSPPPMASLALNASPSSAPFSASMPNATAVSSSSTNPYAPQHRSTGNSAADEKLAALYKAREQMRQQFMPTQSL